jgi:ABC-2 type transport system ATP-binding protein
MSSSSIAIALSSVRKAFRTVIAVEGVSFEVQRGEIFGLLGPNGAGKTTLLRLIMDIFRPDSGHIEVFGRGFQKQDKARIGYLPEERGLYTRQRVQDVIEYLVQLKGVPHTQARPRTLHC